MRDRIGKIEVETGHLVQMVNELLDLSRIEGGAGWASWRTWTSDTWRSRPPSASGCSQSDRASRSRRWRRACATGPRRRGASRPGAGQPAPQRRQVQPGRRRGPVVGRAPTTTSRSSSVTDHGVGIPKPPQDSDLRAVLQGRPGARPGGGDGPRPRDRPPRRGGPRRADLGRVRGGRRLDIRVGHPDRAGDAPRRPPARLTPEEHHGSPARRDPQHPQPGRSLGGAPAAGLATWHGSGRTCSVCRRSST